MGYYHPVPDKDNQAGLAKQYGVKGANTPRPGMTNSRGGFRSANTVDAKTSEAMSNDYSTREFLKYNDDARNKMKNGLPSNQKQNRKLHEMMGEAHKEAGNGGKYDNRFDRAGVAQQAFEDYMSQYKMKGSGKKKEAKPADTKEPAEETTVYSPEIQQAKERAQNFQNSDQAEVADDDKVFKASNAFLNKQHDFSKKEFTG